MLHFDRFKKGLAKTRELTLGRLAELLGRGKLDFESLAEVEEALLAADVGVPVVEKLILTIRERARQGSNGATPKELMSGELLQCLRADSSRRLARFSVQPWVIILAGVNGSGKTTTVGKLAHYFGQQGKRSVIAAADTFRAAAVEQVEAWARRSGSRIIKQAPGADPAAVAFDACQSARACGEDLLLIDTAGRMQTRQNLMQELAKITRVLKRFDESTPQEVLLVIDATTGQNGLSQARGFVDAAGVSGLIVTKLDGTARGGIVIPIQSELKIPVEFVGVGENIDDLFPFNPRDYVNALLEA